MLEDSYSRKFKYVRLSLTEKCNFSCQYCLPDGYQGCTTKQNLTLQEILNLGHVLKKIGATKLRLTGGEPMLRRDLIDIISALKNDVGIEQIALTTNGFILEKNLANLKKAGLAALNISLDTLQPQKFNQICGVNLGEKVLNSILLATEMEFDSLKVNVVLLKNINDIEFFDFVNFVQDKKISVRFIELMLAAENKDYFKKHHLSVSGLIKQLKQLNWVQDVKMFNAGPAKEFSNPNYKGKIGFISPYEKNFCDSCNRLRISSTGELRLCLFGEGSLSLREFIQQRSDADKAIAAFMLALRTKPMSHQLQLNNFGDMRTFSSIGG